MLKSEFEYILSPSSTVEYSSDGKVLKARFITLKAPAKKHRKLVMKLFQYWCRANIERLSKFKPSETENQEENIEQEIKPEDSKLLAELIKATLCMSSEIDINDPFDVFEELLIDVGFSNGVEQLRISTLKDISIEDTLQMMGEYISNFTVIL